MRVTELYKAEYVRDVEALFDAIERELAVTPLAIPLAAAARMAEEHADAAVAEVTRERDEARAEVERLREAATELLEVADLRGDSVLPYPEDDPIDWTARMQDAWDGLRAVLKPADGGEGVQ
jgi:hypothetical protein